MALDLSFWEEAAKMSVSNEYSVDVESVKIKGLKVSPGSKKGDGFACLIAALDFCAVVGDKSYEKHYIAKYADDEKRKELLSKIGAFEREGDNYTWFMPTLQKLRKDKNMKRLSLANCFYASTEKCVLVLDNLKAKGFDVIKKQAEPLTIESVQMVLTELAALHATGFFYYTTHPDGEEKLAKDHPYLFTKKFMGGTSDEKANEIFGAMFAMCGPMLATFAEVVRNEGDHSLAEKMQSFVPDITAKVLEVFNAEWRHIVVTHGDAWFNNFLFKYESPDSKTPDEIVLIDLQGTQLGRVGIELVYYLISSSSPEQRELHFDRLLQVYYDTFCSELEKLQFDGIIPFTYQELLDEYNSCYAYGFGLGCMHIQGLLFTDDTDLTLDITQLTNENGGQDFALMFKENVLARAKTDEKYKKLILGLAREGHEKGLY